MARDEVWTVSWLQERGDGGYSLAQDEFDDRKALEARLIHLSATGVQHNLVAGPIVPVTVDTSPRITFEAPAKKTRAPRSDKGKPRAKKGEVT